MNNQLDIILKVAKVACISFLLNIGLVYAEFEPIRINQGQNRVFETMYKGPGGIAQVNRKVLFAETKNLNTDLNTPEISSRFGCKTKMGQAFIAYTLDKPISPHDQNSIIKNRQNFIQLLLDHPELQAKFEELMHEAVEHEAVLMKFMAQRFVINMDANPIEVAPQILDKFSLYQVYNQFSRAATLWATGDELAKMAFSFYNMPIDQKMLLAGLGLFGLDREGKFYKVSETLPIKVWIGSAAFLGLYAHYVKALHIRNSLYALNRLLDIAQRIEDVCREYGVKHQFKLSSIRSVKGLELLDGLRHDRYKEKDSMLILTPLIHTFVYDVYEHDLQLAPLYASIAEMDAYVAIAKKMDKLQSTEHKLTFTQFLDYEKPTIQATGFWNMLVSTGNIVVNDISEDRNIILTGANEGGKTTAIRAILQNIILAQTFGIAAAEAFACTQFDVIHSYLNVSDDILHGKSRYASELKLAQDILLKIKTLQPHEKYFFVLDELFTGTNGEDGAQAAYGFIDNIASYDGMQFIYATHFNILKTIGANNLACANYKIEPPLRNDQGQFIRDAQGQLIYPYKLSPGANDVNVALDRAKDAGIFK